MIYDIIILIPVYNNLKGLKNSIASATVSSTSIFFVIVDDGSISKETPGEGVLVGRNGKIIKMNSNSGITKALNTGLDYIKQYLNYKYLARLDSGDICINNRLEDQFSFLEQSCDIGFIGSWAKIVNFEGKLLYELKTPVSPEEINKLMFINNAFVHPSLMIRKEIVDQVGKYSEKFPAAEDYDLCFRMLKISRGVNLPVFHIEKEYSKKSISVARFKIQVFSRIKIIWRYRYLNRFFLYGLIRNILILFIPHTIIEKWKKK